MDYIFHEKQVGSLCAQHCLNSLLQGAYFTAADLSVLAMRLDEEERRRMAENGEDSEEYQRFLQQPSGNMDDSGFFSVQVISSALQVWNLELMPYTGPDAIKNSNVSAFICNYHSHWFTIRKIGQHWYNLNSLLARPALLSDTYLALFLTQLLLENYSIFSVEGQLPRCSFDDAVQARSIQFAASPHSLNYDEDLETAIRLSLTHPESLIIDNQDRPQALHLDQQNDEVDDQLQAAINLSLQC